MNNKAPHNTQELKILPKWFEDVQANKKNFEIRKNDRNFEVGDYLILKEWYRGKFTGRYVIRQIEYIYKCDGTYGLSEDYCVLGLKLPSVTPTHKKGKWVKSNIGGAKVCSICQAHMGLSNFKFCPNCGAEMESEE